MLYLGKVLVEKEISIRCIVIPTIFTRAMPMTLKILALF